jgi:hypothetical protein
MRDANEKAALAEAAMVALEPLVQLLLEIGVNCPEAESLFRSIFVHKARDWLTEQGRHKPSDVQIAHITGIHRNFVHEILKGPPKISALRRARGLKLHRLLDGWRSDSAYVDSDGKPVPLFRTAPEPSLKSLIAKYLPGAPAGGTIQQLLRNGLVQTLPGDRILIRTAVRRTKGVSLSKLAAAGELGRAFLATLRHNLSHPSARLFCGSVPKVTFELSHAPAIRSAIAKRAAAFLSEIADELAKEISLGKVRRRHGTEGSVKVGLTVFQTEDSMHRP